VAEVPSAAPEVILRFRRSERLLHWAIAAPFTVCYLTAVVLLVVYNPNPRLPYRLLFSWTHRISGVCLIAFPVLVALTHIRDARVYLDNVRRAWAWSLADVKWLALTGPATFNKRISLPDQGKFNAGEKLNFMALTATYPLYIVTGILIWMPGIAFASWVLHVSMAAVATPLIFGHVFMATVNPDTRPGLPGMFSGYVSRKWAEHHYALWYRETYGHEVRPAPKEKKERAPLRPPVEIRCPSCGTVSGLVSTASLVEGLFEEASLTCRQCGTAPESISAVIEDGDLDLVLARLARGRGGTSVAWLAAGVDDDDLAAPSVTPEGTFDVPQATGVPA
jgi:formate dehydrogenase subunit gamma